jgi:type I restriction enzyme S subunit
MSEWKEVKLGNLLDIKHGFAFPGSGITEEKTNHILVTPGNFNIGGGFKSMKLKYFKGNYPEEYVLKADDLVVTMTDLSQETDTLGYSAKIPHNNNVNYLHNQRIGLIKLISNELNKDFIYWLMRTKEYQSFIVSSASGTAIMHTSPSRIKEYSCLIPPLSEQENIAEILNSLDDKIDLLQRNNKTLEQLAETLFRQWFVEEREVGCKKSTLGELVKVIDNRGKTPSFTETKTDYPIIEVNALNGKNRYIDYSLIKKYVDEHTYNNWFRAGHPKLNDILFSTVGSIGEMSMLLNPTGTIAQNIVALRAEKISPYYLYQYLMSIQDEIKEFDIGSVQPSIKVTHLTKIEIPMPDSKKVNLFDNQAKDICNKISINYNQIQKLETLRDTLLPKLMSGTIKIAND